MDKKILLIGILLLVIPFSLAEKPDARKENNTFIMPFTLDGREYRANDKIIIDDWAFYALEYDPNIKVSIRVLNKTDIILKISRNPFSVSPSSDIPLEVCFMDEGVSLRHDDRRLSLASRCLGVETSTVPIYSLSYSIDFENEYLLSFTEDTPRFQFFLGDGAGGGGGGIGCTPICSPCYVSSLTHGSTPSSSNTETTFTHYATAVMVTCSGCQCVLSYRHKTNTQYVPYTSSYPNIDKSMAKLISGANSKVITTSGTYTNTIQCGVKHGTLDLRLDSQGFSAPIYSYKAVTCNDVVKPNINLSSPANNTVFSGNNSVSVNFVCNASDNTGLKYIDLYGNWSGTWQLEQSQSYGNLVYSASKTFTEVFNVNGSRKYNWNCRARDTRSPNNDNWAVNNRTIIINVSRFPGFIWEFPTPADNVLTTNRSAFLNVSVSSDSETTAFFDWNYTLGGFWSFDLRNSSGILDNSSDKNFMRYNGGLSENNITLGVFGKALEFDGTNDYLETNQILKGNKASYGGWFKFDTFSCLSNFCVPMQQANAADSGYEIYAWGLTNSVYCWDGFSGTSGHAINTGTWYHIICTHDGKNVRLWVNGSNVQTAASTFNVVNEEFTIGGGVQQNNYWFDGFVDEAIVFNRNISGEEILSLYNNSKYRLQYNFTNLSVGSTYFYKAFANDREGNFNGTEWRNFTVIDFPTDQEKEVLNIVLKGYHLVEISRREQFIFPIGKMMLMGAVI